jgi:hypothetical protein
MHLSSSYLHAQTPQTAHFLALDVTIPALPSPSDAQPTAATATIQHDHKAEKAKFEINGSRMSIQVFQDLINQQILLLLVTIDHLSGLGTLAYHLLFGNDNKKAPNTYPLTPQLTSLYARFIVI